MPLGELPMYVREVHEAAALGATLGVEVLLGVEIDHLAQPFQPLVLFHQPGAVLVLVFPMGGDPVLGQGVHVPRPDLDLEGLLVLGEDGGVQRSVEVGLGHGDEIAEPVGKRRPFLVDDAQGGVTGGDILHDQAHAA